VKKAMIIIMTLVLFLTTNYAVEIGLEYGYDILSEESTSRTNLITTNAINEYAGIRFGIGILSNGFDIKENSLLIGYEQKFTFFETTLGLITDGFINMNPEYNGFGVRFAGELGWLVTQKTEFNVGIAANMNVTKDLSELKWKFTPYLGVSYRF
jgi:hypothetical protein